MWQGFLKSFIPLFFALDVLGVLPLYARFSIGLDEKRRGKVLRDSMVTAFLITLAFIAIGNGILRYLNVSIQDFQIAGGVILFILSTKDLLGGRVEDLAGQEDLFAVVPLGVPLLAGPAVLTTSLIVFNTFGFPYVFVSLLLNLLIAAILFKYSLVILRLISRRWVEAMAKVFVLLLASIAVMFIRTGLQGLR
jgi:multiple antibiotic resistance protein